MRFLRGFKFNIKFVIRLVADALMVSLALLLGLFIRFMDIVWRDEERTLRDYQGLINHYTEIYFSDFWLITLICLIAFAASGFYTRGRNYRSRYKALIIFQAVGIGYLISAFVLYILVGKGVQASLDISDVAFPRAAFIISWLLTLVLVGSSRLWTTLWRWMIHAEEKQKTSTAQRINEHVLVVGGAGYIGSALVKYLLDSGYTVRLLDILLYGVDPIADVIDHPKLEIMQADFRQIDRVYEAMQDMDIVVHLGAIVGDPACDLDEKMTIEVNTTATRMVAEVARSQRVDRFIFASTCSVYGASKEILDEHSNLHPLSLYARSKLAAEHMLLNMASPDFHPVILRFGTLYGFSARIRFDLVVNLLTAKAMQDEEIVIFGGEQWRPFVHVEDAARCILKIIEAPLENVQREIFNVGSNEQNYRIREIGEFIKSIIPSAELINREGEMDPRDYRVNFGKIKNIIGLDPKWTVEKGIEQVAQAIESGRVKDYRDSLYSNEKFLIDEGTSKLQIYPLEWIESYLPEVKKKEEQKKERVFNSD